MKSTDAEIWMSQEKAATMSINRGSDNDEEFGNSSILNRMNESFEFKDAVHSKIMPGNLHNSPGS